eukprot:9087966-Alexandrium_andersonii.AAC.1
MEFAMLARSAPQPLQPAHVQRNISNTLTDVGTALRRWAPMVVQSIQRDPAQDAEDEEGEVALLQPLAL